MTDIAQQRAESNFVFFLCLVVFHELLISITASTVFDDCGVCVCVCTPRYNTRKKYCYAWQRTRRHKLNRSIIRMYISAPSIFFSFLPPLNGYFFAFFLIAPSFFFFSSFRFHVCTSIDGLEFNGKYKPKLLHFLRLVSFKIRRKKEKGTHHK